MSLELDTLVSILLYQAWRRLKESQPEDTEPKPTWKLFQGEQLHIQEGASADSEMERKLSEQHQLIQRLQQENKELQNSLEIAKIEV